MDKEALLVLLQEATATAAREATEHAAAVASYIGNSHREHERRCRDTHAQVSERECTLRSDSTLTAPAADASQVVPHIAPAQVPTTPEVVADGTPISGGRGGRGGGGGRGSKHRRLVTCSATRRLDEALRILDNDGIQPEHSAAVVQDATAQVLTFDLIECPERTVRRDEFQTRHRCPHIYVSIVIAFRSGRGVAWDSV